MGGSDQLKRSATKEGGGEKSLPLEGRGAKGRSRKGGWSEERGERRRDFTGNNMSKFQNARKDGGYGNKRG